MKNSRVYWLISVCSCFVIILKFTISSVTVGGVEDEYVMVTWEAALPIVLHSSRNYHQEHAREPNRLHKDVAAACGAVMLRFHGVSNLYR